MIKPTDNDVVLAILETLETAVQTAVVQAARALGVDHDHDMDLALIEDSATAAVRQGIDRAGKPVVSLVN